MRHLIRIVAAAVGVLAACVMLAGRARADTYPVNDPSDLPDASVGDNVCATAAGTCTLRAAVQEANAHAGPDSISLPAGTYILTRTGAYEASALTGDLDLRDTLTITGAGRTATIIDGNLNDRIFDVFPAVSNAPMTATLTGLTFRRGGNIGTGCGMDITGAQTRVFLSQVDIRDGACPSNFGYGGIYFYNAFLLSLNDVIINNNAGYYGGGVYQYYGQVFISGTLISNNSGANGAGAQLSNGFVSITRSAIVDNRATSNGGGLYLAGVNGGITQTTIAGNSATGNGGGVYLSLSAALLFGWDTIARNTSAGQGGGAYVSSDGMKIRGTLIGANAAPSGQDVYCSSTLTSLGYNLIGNTTSCGGSYYTAGSGDIVNVNPGVGIAVPLAGTRVVPLVYGSPAIDTGGAGCPALDQRNQPRPADGDGDGSAACDIGAYEKQGPGELSLAGAVYADTNLNSLWDPGVDPGLPGVTVTLAELGGGSVMTGGTGADGSFAFGALTTGTWVLRAFQPAGFDDGVDALGTAGGVLGNDVFTVSLVAATPALSYTFGEYPFAAVSGTVYLDQDGNGIYNPPADSGLTGVGLTLQGTSNKGQPVLLNTSTYNQGGFNFFPVPPGVYTLTEAQPGSYFDGDEIVGSGGGAIAGAGPNFDMIANIPVTYGVPVTGYLFAEMGSRNVSAFVYADWNGNGSYGDSEMGLGGQQIRLTGVTYRGGIVSQTLPTNASGSASFSGLAPGVYTLTETQPLTWADGLDSVTGAGIAGNDIVTGIALTGTSISASAQFGELVPGVSGVVYVDADANGRYGNETGLTGVSVWLSGVTDLGAGAWMTATTDPRGRFFFRSVPTGTYALSEQQPAGLLDGFEQVGAGGGVTGAIEADIISGIVFTPTTAAGRPDAAAGNTFGEVVASSLEGFVYLDADNNQSLTYSGSCPASCDPPIFGVTIVLTGVNDAGQSIWMTTTTTTGTIPFYSYIGARYAFTPLRPGAYSVIELQPLDYNDGPLNYGSPYALVGDNRFDAILLVPGTQGGRYNFGEYPPGLGGYIYQDSNNDGIYQHSRDSSLSGVGVTLTWRTITGASGSSTAQTSYTGRYVFSGLVTGTYTLTELQPGYYADGRESVPTLPAVVGNDIYAGIAYTPGAGGGGFNFGELSPGAITVRVFYDRNANGVYDNNDTGITGITVTLTGTTDVGYPIGPIVLNSGPGSNSVSFNPLGPGVYSLVETQPSGYVDGASIIGTYFGGMPGLNRIDAVTIVTPGFGGSGYAFTEQKVGLSGFLYQDANNNRFHDDSEYSFNQVTVALSGTGGSALFSTTLSGYDGFYLFSGVPSGTYQITTTQYSSYLDSFDQPGAIDGVPSGMSGTLGTDRISAIGYPAGGVGLNYNFGDIAPSRIRGSVYQDLNSNAIFDSGATPYETGIRYVSVTLTGADDAGASVLFTRVTDVNGAFDFDTLRPGLYILTETQPAGYADGGEQNNYPWAAQYSNDRFEGITITTPGANVAGFNFGELLNGLYGYVFSDINNDGVNTNGYDTAISNARVALSGTTIFGQPVYSVTLTDFRGRFLFNRLVTGTYVLTETQPAGYLDGIDTAGSLGGSASSLAGGDDILSGIVITDGSYGRNYLFGELPPAQINGYVFLDLNADGFKVFSEPGIQGVTMTLSGIDDRGQMTTVVTTTYASGQFFFANIRPGNYAISETQPAGYLDGLDRNRTGVLGTVNDYFDNIVVAPGTTYATYYFGESGSFFSGAVYADKNNNGARDVNESGIQYVTIHLTGTRSDNGATVGQATQTDSAGVYQFVNVPNGTYTLTELQPAAWFDGRETLGAGAGGVISGNDRFISLSMSGPGGSNYNFGEIGPATVNGYVYIDLGDDGNRTGEDPGIGGVVLTLRGTDYVSAPILMTATTSQYGGYSFSGVRAGVYTLTEAQPAGYPDGKDRANCCGAVVGNDIIANITIPPELYVSGFDFGERLSGLSGYVYRDGNNNGLRDDGLGIGLGGVPIDLNGFTALGTLVTRSTTTDGYGLYFFSDLLTGTYRISQTWQIPYMTDGIDTLGTLGGALGANDEFIDIAFTPGQTGLEYNFGEFYNATIGGSVYWDLNNDGQKQGGEPGILGATVILSGVTDINQRVRFTTTTGAEGTFYFSTLRPGVYSLLELQPANYTDGKDTPGWAGGSADGLDAITGIGLGPGWNASGYLFGERQEGLSGYVYADLNNNGARGVGTESGIGSALIGLAGTTDLGEPVIRNTLSNGFGFYAFSDLASGTYRVSEYQPSGVFDGLDALGTLGGELGEDVYTVTYVAGDYGAEYNFGEIPPATLAGQVFVDINGDGVHQYGEAGIPAVALGLAGVDDLGASVVRAALAGGYGYYTFGNLRPGVYTLTEIQPAGYTDGAEIVGTLGGTPAPPDSIAQIVVGVAVYGNGYEFGETQTGLGGFVYHDATANGSKDNGEAVLPGVTLILTGTLAGGNPITRTAVTDGSGFYGFGDLAAGAYRIRQIQPPNYLDGPDSAGAQGGAPGPLGQDYIDVAYAGVAFGSDYNFGEYYPGALEGNVFFDLNDNGRYEHPVDYWWSPESPIQDGVNVVLTGRNDLSQSLWITDTTNTGGFYRFSLLRPGVYTLTEIQRDVDVDGMDWAVVEPGMVLANDEVRNITLGIGQVKRAYFGEKPSLTGFVYRDDNENGIYEPSPATGCNSPELGIQFVNLQLTGVDVYNRNVTLNTATFYPDPRETYRCNQGLFYFGGLVTGTYALREFQPGDFLDGQETVGTGGGLTTTNDIISRIVFTPGVVITNYNFGELRNVIEGSVYLDANGNGVKEPHEGGVNNPATVVLRGVNNLGQSVWMTRTTYGSYQFTGLRPGVYTLTELQPAGYADGQEQLGAGAGGAIGDNDQFVNLVLAPGAIASGYNFGELIGSSLGGRVAYVWFAGEGSYFGQGLVSQTIRLNGTLIPSGSLIMTMTTDVSGYYRFNSLPPGAYTVTQIGMPLGYADFGALSCHWQASTQGRSIRGIPLEYGSYVSNCDFMLGPTLTGYVFADHNANGVIEYPEAGISFVAVSLYGVSSDGAPSTRTVSTSTGFFAFGGLLTGTYRLVETQPGGFYDGADIPGSLGGLTGTAALSALPAWSPPITNDIIAGIVFTPGALGQNYLFAELLPAELRGVVYYDKDDTGTLTPCCISPYNGQDEVIYPVRVILDGVNDLGAQVLMTNPYDSGAFEFTGLRPGVYTLTETQPPTYTDGIDNVGSTGGVLGNDQIRFINLTWGDHASGYNFGERKFGIIGTVFADRNNNGVFNPPNDGTDSGIPGVVVWLTGTTAIGDPVLMTTTSSAVGAFSFANLQPGVYTLSETQPSGYADGLDRAGTLGGLLSNDRITGIVVGDQSFGQNYAFGELPPSTLSGYVYVDINNDGYRVGEPGIAGVTITLQGQNTLGDPVLMVARTDALGYYIFRNIPNGSYSLIETQPNFVDGIDRAGSGAGGVALDDLIVGIGFNIIADARDYNFGERPSALSGHVFWDENGNGTREISETGLSPATLRLRGVDFNSQPVNKTTKTTFEGYYAFEALPGTYWIEQVQPFGYLNGLAIPGTLGGVVSGANVITNIVVGIGGAGVDYDFAEVAPTAVDMARAMGLDLAFLQSGSMQTDLVNKAGVGGLGTPTLAGFPTHGPTFAYLGTGNMLFADQSNSGPNTFGLGDYTRLALTFTVPVTATCLSMDFAFFSEEFPEFVGSQFNDTFDAFVDGQPIARDQNGNRISINSVFGATPGNALGTTYDAATPRLRARAALTPGATSVITFFVTDVSDTAYDSAVFIDKFTFGRPEGEACVPGANLPVGVVLTKTVSLWPEAGNPVCGLTDALTITQPTEIAYCYRANNTGEYTLTTHSLVDSAFGPLFSQMPLELLPGETFEYITSRVETQTAVSVGTWTGAYSGTFAAASTDATTVTLQGPVITPTPSPGSATLMILPGSAQTYYTQPITVGVMISGVTNLGGYEVALRFDPAQVTVTDVSQGSFLTTTGRGLILVPTRFGPDYARFGASTVGPAAGPSGSGALAWVRIAPRESGTATLTLSNTLATNVAGLSIELTAIGGQLVVIHPGAAYLPRVLR